MIALSKSSTVAFVHFFVSEDVKTRKIIDCPECGGDGKVYYGPEHPIVNMGFGVGEYNCPMCEGGGKLAEDL